MKSPHASSGASAAAPRVLVLGAVDGPGGPAPGVEVVDWALAQQAPGIARLAKYSSFVCLPARFPSGVVDHERERMCVTLRRRFEAGALALLLVPAWESREAAETDGDWVRIRFVVEAVTGLRLEPLLPGDGPPQSAVTPAARGSLARYLRRAAPTFRLEGNTDDMEAFSAAGEVLALGVLGDVAGGVTAAAVAMGEGAAAVIPAASPDSFRDLGAVLGLLPDLERLRARGRRLHADASSRTSGRATVASLGRPPSLQASRRKVRAATALAPRDLPERHLCAVPVSATRGAVHFRPSGASPRSSPELGRGAWVLAMVILDTRRFARTPPAPIDLADVEEALRDADVPATKRASIRGYLGQLRRAVEAALGHRLPPHAIEMPRGERVIEIRGLAMILGPSGASVRTLRLP